MKKPAKYDGMTEIKKPKKMGKIKGPASMKSMMKKSKVC
jgi:hypothetical protein